MMSSGPWLRFLLSFNPPCAVIFTAVRYNLWSGEGTKPPAHRATCVSFLAPKNCHSILFSQLLLLPFRKPIERYLALYELQIILRCAVPLEIDVQANMLSPF